jgi:hypothetical protein
MPGGRFYRSRENSGQNLQILADSTDLGKSTPIGEGMDEKEAHADARQTGKDWQAASAGKDFLAGDEPGTTE